MISDPVLRWVVTGLFVLSAAECGYAILAKRRPWTMVVSHGLHFAMSVAMVVMVWPRGAQLPASGPMLLFLWATAVFATMALVVARTPTLRLQYGYNSLMMLATAWMYALMDDDLLTIRSGTQSVAHSGAALPGTGMATMTMSASGGSPAWLGAINWCGTVTFAAAAVFWTHKHIVERLQGIGRSRSLGSLGQAAMAAGMTILFVATLFRI
ncbi:DUF5134 domain-containing protein [Mycobacterium botniense]|uniref:DUF5134 domain-containing protein n=1 Tax=Mycobacterium botniense TaxID=84962 RepID=A0A7I9XVX0_9MYCO|nr:DUF5134 domain-containing protein [Mycobacterium botniense]GFG73941.1 hypothetical protein MBOT_13060 [Mycobacterium botniense]